VSCEQIYNCIEKVDDLQEYAKTVWKDPTQITEPITHTSFDIKPQKGTEPDRSLTPYNSDELDLLALFATVVKIAFVVGGLGIIPNLVKLVEPAREGRELHLTAVRNEMAYYSCCVQILLHQRLPLLSYRKIYFVGDSHCLAPGWKVINFQGEKTLLHPALVTGLKIWHLRPHSKFFPKANFYNIIGKIPKGATIIICFGEIDCREGLLVSVEKCKYKDMQDACVTVVEIYMKILHQLLDEYKFTIYVHPPPPVLDPTRKVVKQFAQVLRDRIAKEPRLKWLDIFDALMTPDKEDLAADYKFDGTHLHPCYVSLLESALTQCSQ